MSYDRHNSYSYSNNSTVEPQHHMVYRMEQEAKRNREEASKPRQPYKAPKLDAQGRYTEGLSKGLTPAQLAEMWYNK